MATNKESTKHVTRQWVKKEHFEAFVRCSKLRPDLYVRMNQLEEDETGVLILAQFTFTNVGRNLYTQRLIHFICTSLTEYQTETTNL